MSCTKTCCTLLVVGAVALASAPRPAPVAESSPESPPPADGAEGVRKAIESGGGDIRLPRGVYRITRPIVIDLDKVGYTSIHGGGVARIVMAGPGPALRFVGTHLGTADPWTVAPKVWDRQRMPLVDGLAISGDHEDAVGIEASGTMQLTITRVHIRGVRHGIHLVGNNRNVVISDSHIYENRGVGIYYDRVNLHQSNIVGCHVSYNGGGGIVSRGGNVRNIQIAGCDLESNMSADLPATANVLIDCRGSRYGTAEVAITGCTIQHNHTSPSSANIRMLGRSQRGPAEGTREGLVTITGNVLSDVAVNIHLAECRGVTISGNTAWRAYRQTLLVENCSNVVVGPNSFVRRDPRARPGDKDAPGSGIVLRHSEDCTVSGLHVCGVWGGAAGVLVERCRRLNITGCTILDCQPVGLLLREVTDSRVSDCLIRDDRPGKASVPLKVVGGSGNLIVDNVTPAPAGSGSENAGDPRASSAEPDS